MAITAADQTKLLRATKLAAEQSEILGDRHAAMVKVARDERLQPGMIRLVCNAVNSGAQTAQRLNSDDILEKLASFPLLNADDVIRDVYHSKQAASTCTPVGSFDAPVPMKRRNEAAAEKQKRAEWQQDREKQASAQAPAAPQEPKLKLSDLEKLAKAVEQARHDAVIAADDCEQSLEKLALYCQLPAHRRKPLAQIEKLAIHRFGEDTVKPIFDIVHARMQKTSNAELRYALTKEKRASEIDNFIIDDVRAFDIYLNTVVAPVISNAIKVAETAQRHEDLKAEQVFAKEAYVTQLSPAKPPQENIFADCFLEEEVTTKEAGFFSIPALNTGVGAMLGHGMRFAGGPSDKEMVDKAMRGLDDPDHLAELQRVRRTAMLNAMMTDPNDPLSGYAPEQIMHEYNLMSQLAPTASMQPAIVGPVLRKRLSGHPETFENQQVAELEGQVLRNKGLSTAPQLGSHPQQQPQHGGNK